MKNIYAVILCVVLLLVSACAEKVNDPADVQAIKKSIDDYAKAMNAGDADQAVALVTDKAIYPGSHYPVTVGKEAIRSMHATWFTLFKMEFSCPVEDVRVVGDLAVARGSWTEKDTPKAQAFDLAPGLVEQAGQVLAVFFR